MPAMLLQQKTTLPQRHLGARNHLWPRRLYRVQMHSTRQRRKKGRVRGADAAQEILHVRARFDHEGPAKLTVDRMLDDYVQDLDSIVDQNLQLFFSSLGNVLAGKQGTMRPDRGFREAVTLRRG